MPLYFVLYRHKVLELFTTLGSPFASQRTIEYAERIHYKKDIEKWNNKGVQGNENSKRH